MLRSVRMLAACSAMILMAAETGSGSGGDQSSSEGETVDLAAALVAMTKERDEALEAGATAIGELQTKINELTITAATADKECERLDAALKKAIKERDAAQKGADRAGLMSVGEGQLALNAVVTGKVAKDQIADNHYVLRTSRIDGGDHGGLARGRVVTVSERRVKKMADKIRPATVAEVEASRHPIVHLA